MYLLAQEPISPLHMIMIAVILIVLFAMFVMFAIFLSYFRWWIQSFFTGAKITFWDLVGMSFRKVKPSVIVPAKIMAVQARLQEPEMTTKALEAHYVAGGNVPMVVRAMIAANKAKTIKLSFREATAIDLAGRNVLEAVQTSVYPRVIDLSLIHI